MGIWYFFALTQLIHYFLSLRTLKKKQNHHMASISKIIFTQSRANIILNSESIWIFKPNYFSDPRDMDIILQAVNQLSFLDINSYRDMKIS